MAKLSYIEISKENLLGNIRNIKQLLKVETKLAAVVKANAYGHGMEEIVDIVQDYIDYFQVDDIDELHRIRKLTSKPVLVLGYIKKTDLHDILKLNCVLAVYDMSNLESINSAAEEEGVNAIVHVAIDALLGREGILIDNLSAFISKLSDYSHIQVEGVYAHFANIEDTSDFTHAQKQIDTYKKALKIFSYNGFSNLLTHISATSGILVYEKTFGENSLVRLGIGMYGLWPSEDLKLRYEKDSIYFTPILRWISHIGQIKTLPANYSIGYGLTYTTSKETKIALIPQGYSDGYDRGLSNIGEVLIREKRCHVLGRVAMNMFVVDVTNLEEVEIEDEVVLLGKQGNETISAEEIALKIGTINYEVVARLSSLLPRVVV